MLDIQGGPHIDAGAEQLLDVLPPLGGARTRGVGMGVFVHQQELGLAR